MQAGVEAGSQARRETLDACKRLSVTPGFVISNLKRLARYKGKKPFKGKDDDILYSRPLDDTSAQLGALKELATILDMRPKDNEGKPKTDRLGELARVLMDGPAADDADNNEGGGGA
ncbi:MAG: hypothetical protein A4E65_00342 [Syntrophorhabdus sp. PtaU1.Bin153]|nr:MAG: hypothetical protein A4E65_00342 [Syntrophorhabdus sp. PtaU1.Bin153]